MTANVPSVSLKITGVAGDVTQYDSCDVEFTAYHEPHKFEVSMPVTTAIRTALIQTKSPRCDIYVDGAPWFFGLLDDADGDIVSNTAIGDTVKLTGQDLMKSFFRTPILEAIKSQTASAWLEARAKAHGLKLAVTPTDQQIGALVDSNFQTLSNHRKESDLLSDLSAWTGNVAYVDLDTFHWGPPPPTTTHVAYTLGGNVDHLRWKKSYDAEQIRVEVISWSPRKKKGLKQSKQTAGNGGYLIRIVRPGLTDHQAAQLAQATLVQAERSALFVDFMDLPGDKSLRGIAWDFKLFNVGDGLSQQFFPTVVKHKFTPDSYLLDVSAFNRVEAQA